MSKEDQLKTLDMFASVVIELRKKLAQLSAEHWDQAKKAGLNPGDLESLASKIGKLVEGATKKDLSSNVALLNVLTEAGEDAIRGLRCTMEVLSIDTSKLTDKQRSILALYIYLSASEGHFSEAVQIITFLLMENHHDLYDPFRSKFVNKYDELNDLSIYVQLQFIEAHGFGFVVDSFDRRLRNCIAHQGFLVEDNGDIIETKTRKKLTDSDETLKKTMLLLGINATVNATISKEIVPLLDEVTGKIEDLRRACKT